MKLPFGRKAVIGIIIACISITLIYLGVTNMGFIKSLYNETTNLTLDVEKGEGTNLKKDWPIHVCFVK
ncbi:hypothetical protein GCM10010913_32520 [Paenibacillus aceti]|uniref:Uncharacterized protein n=1 Tax=Paenibacillus aceti TaxID=1820010 RepID=A0ABQ1W1B8_9BACL|nr:hypothetical protein GCM10010913_32520 [Paenibacillus aceti]